jgi:hypothetical protein
MKIEGNLQTKIGLGKTFLPMVASPVPEGSRRRGKIKSHENSAPAARQPSWLSIQVMRVRKSGIHSQIFHDFISRK